MKYVSQVHRFGCGAATLAMLTGVGYQRMARMLLPTRKSGQQYWGTELTDVLRVLEKLKYKCRISFRKKDFSKLKHNAYISVINRNGSYHAIAWDAANQKVLDPYKKRSVYIDPEYAKKRLHFTLEVWKE